jgi:hypothetical protein
LFAHVLLAHLPDEFLELLFAVLYVVRPQMLHQRVSEEFNAGLFTVFIEDMEKLEVYIFQNGPHHFLALGN